MIAWWKRDVGLGIFVHVLRAVCSRSSANISRRAAISASVARSVASRAAMLSSAAQTVIISRISRLVLRTTKTPRRGTDAHEALLLEQRHRLADRRAADAEILRQLALVEPDVARVAVDVHLR